MRIDPVRGVYLAYRKHSQHKLVGRTPGYRACRRYQIEAAHRRLATERRNQVPPAEILIEFESNVRVGRSTVQHRFNVECKDERLVTLASRHDSGESALNMNKLGLRSSRVNRRVGSL